MKRLLICAAVLTAAPASATVLADWDLHDLAARADSVVIGVVADQQSLRVDGRLMTETTVVVEQTLRGHQRPTLVVSQLGGREGSLVNEVVGTAPLIPGRRVVLFTYAHRDGRRYVVGMALGAFFLRDDGSLTRRIDVPLLARDGSLRPAPGRLDITLGDVAAALAGVEP